MLDGILDEMIAGSSRILAQAPTGSGKTVIASELIRRERGRSMFVVHRQELLRQSVAALQVAGVECGVIAAGYQANLSLPVQVASIDTLRRRLDITPKPKLLIIDEAHHSVARTWRATIDGLDATTTIGFTATPELLSGKGLGEVYEAMVLGKQPRWLIQNDYLSKYRYFDAPSDFDGAKTKMGDFDQTETARKLDRPKITGSVVSHYLEHASHCKGIVFCVNIEHSRHVVQAFQDSGVPAAHVDGETPAYERVAAIEGLRSGRIKILTNVGLFTEGVDLPGIDYIGLLRPTQSLGLYLQMVGRGLRFTPNKQYCLIFDHVGNRERHGLPCDDREWTLHAEKRSKRPKKPNQIKVWLCPMCYAYNYSTDKACRCGFEPKPKRQEIEQVNGMLEEVAIEQARRQRKIAQGSARTIGELVAIGRQRGMKNPIGWAKHVINARQNRNRYSAGNYG